MSGTQGSPHKWKDRENATTIYIKGSDTPRFEHGQKHAKQLYVPKPDSNTIVLTKNIKSSTYYRIIQQNISKDPNIKRAYTSGKEAHTCGKRNPQMWEGVVYTRVNHWVVSCVRIIIISIGKLIGYWIKLEIYLQL